MFTPPPSPAPPRHHRAAGCDGTSPQSHLRAGESPSSSESSSPSSSPTRPSPSSTPPSSPSLAPPTEKFPACTPPHALSAAKRRSGARMRWMVILVPVALVFITLSTHYLSHPAAFDALSPTHPAPDFEAWAGTISDWRPHKRHPDPDPQVVGDVALATTLSAATVSDSVLQTTSAAASGSSAPSSSSSAAAGAITALPTIPASTPVLPSPFPQPWDTSLGQTFSTQSCQNYMTSLAQNTNLTACRPFSLLLQCSSAFIEAQSNVSYLNTVLWATCNTDPDVAQCTAYMQSFASDLQEQCATDLQEGIAQVVDALTGLQAYSLMRSAGCLADNSTDTYCYVEAAASTRTADMYLYTLPLASALPSGAQSSCLACSQRVMDTYARDLANLTSLQQTYPAAAQLINAQCGHEYVQTVENGTTPSAALPAFGGGAPRFAGALALAATAALLAAW